MKKSLFALAVLGAFAGAASAQTSVTVYGVADISLAKAVGSSAQMSSSGGLNNGTSRLGFRGTEDLGGGLKAGFNFEAGLNMETGAQTGLQPAGGLFDRAANISLGGTWGTVSAGRMLSTGFHSIAAYELTGTANYGLIGRQFGYQTTRNNSEFRYTTPSFGGFSAAIGHVLEDDRLVGGVPASQTGLNLIYSNGPIAAGLGYTNYDNAGKDVSLGGAYNFGAFKVAASFHDPDGVGKGFQIGGGTTMGPVSLVLDLVRETGGVKHTDVLLEAKYSLSKRTTAYAVWLREGQTGATEGNNFGLGVRHNF